MSRKVPQTRNLSSPLYYSRKDKKDISKKGTDIKSRLKIIASRNILILSITATYWGNTSSKQAQKISLSQ